MYKDQHNPNAQPFAPVGTIVHLGAGRCSELNDHLALQPTHLLLIEADPQLAEALQRRTVDFPQVEVIHRAVAGQPGPVTFYRYNLPSVGSLHRANAALFELFPGLKETQVFQMEAVSPANLLQSLQLQEEQANRLIIDLSGEELSVLKALQQTEQLHLFEQLQLHCGRQALYEGGESATTVIQWLEDQGFDLVVEDNNHDPDRPCWTLKRNKLQLQHRELKWQLTQLEKASEEQMRLLNERQIQLERLTKTCDEQTKIAADWQKQIEQVNDSKIEAEKLAQERQRQIEQLAKARDEQAKRIEQQQVRIQQLVKEGENKANLLAERQMQLEQLTKACDEQTKIAASHQQQRDREKQRADNNQREIREKQESIVKLEQQLAELHQRQPMLDEEFIKAEAQIELIKDILIREKAF